MGGRGGAQIVRDATPVVVNATTHDPTDTTTTTTTPPPLSRTHPQVGSLGSAVVGVDLRRQVVQGPRVVGDASPQRLRLLDLDAHGAPVDGFLRHAHEFFGFRDLHRAIVAFR